MHYRVLPLYSLTFLWIIKFVWKESFKRSPITLARLMDLPAKEFDAKNLYTKFTFFWEKEMTRIAQDRTPRLYFALFHTFLLTFSFVLFVSLFSLAFHCSIVAVLIWQIRALENAQFFSTIQLISIASLLAVCAILQSLCTQTMEYMLNIIGMKCRILLTTAIYHRIIDMPYAQIERISSGNVLTLITSDLFKFDAIFNHSIFLIIGPLGILLVVGLTYIEIGWSAIPIIPIACLHLLIQLSIGYVVSVVYNRGLKYTDARNKHIREIIEGIYLIKCFAWEFAVMSTVERLRRREFLMILSNSFFQTLTISFSTAFPLLYVTVLCISVFVSFGGKLTPSVIFGFLAYTFLYYRLFYQLGLAITGTNELLVSLERVQRILLSPKNNPIKCEYSPIFPVISRKLSAGFIIPKGKPDILVHDVSFKLKKGETMAVIGRVGSGKSSLLISLVNEIDLIQGECHLTGSCAFVPQEPWIISTSIRENITLGKKWDENWYNEVLSLCCLVIDIGQFPQGDLTIVGDRGITLSGGQRARIGLARAVYANTDIYLLDDPLGSVDSQVAEQLLSIFTTGLFSHKTVIIATHQLQFVSQTDQVLLLEDRNVVACGPYSSVKDLTEFKEYSKAITNAEGAYYQNWVPKDEHCYENNVDRVKHSRDEAPFDNARYTAESSPTEEVVRTSNITLSTYAKYLWIGGHVVGNLFLLSFGLISFFFLLVGRNYYLVWWILAASIESNATYANSTFNPLSPLTQNFRILYFVCFCLMLSVMLIPTYLVFAWIPNFASYRLHNRMLWHMLRAPSRFFYRHTSGSIINRFSKDIFTMDHLLPVYYFLFFDVFFQMLFTFVSAAITHWLTLVPSFLLVLALIIFRFQLVKVIRQVKRLESAAKSDVISHASQTLHGITVIHSLELQFHQISKLNSCQNTHSRSWLVYFGYIRYFAFQIDVLISLYAFAVSLVIIFLRHQLSPAISAFALYQIFNLMDTSQFTMRISAEIEMNMVSVERVFDYINLPLEAPLFTNNSFQILRGEIEFIDVQLKYSPELPLILKNISFRVKAGEKIGIVGRTGAGKSSLQTALLRIVELHSGSVRIDGVDVRELGLHELRGQISIIPQDPILFSGTLRFALDPFSSYRDEQLWLALEEVQMKSKIEQLDGQLLFRVSEGGSNFSVGERQLLCLARAILKQSKILMLDEATSFVDSITDWKIQKLIHSKFQSCTVLTIAHRIHTLVNYDRIICLEDGNIISSTSTECFFRGKK